MTDIAEKAGVAEGGVAESLQRAYSPKETTLYDRLCKLFQAMDRGDPIPQMKELTLTNEFKKEKSS